MDYHKFTVEDLVLDQDFRKWVLEEDRESSDFWNAWLKEHPKKINDIQQARKLLKSLQFTEKSLKPSEKDALLYEINSRIQAHEYHDIPTRHLSVDKHVARPPHSRYLKLGIAAILILTFAFTLVLFITRNSGDLYNYKTEFGQTKTFTFPDGTSVVLNANSRIFCKDISKEAPREVWLEGEAFFDVAHLQDKRRFIVHANQIDVVVLGTAFNVYTRGKKSRFELASGKIILENKATDEQLTMQPGEMVSYSSVTGNPVTKKIDVSEVSAWRKNLLVFRRASLEEISDLLKENYNIDVFFTSGINRNRFFTGTVPADDLDILLTTIAKSFDIEIEKRNKTVLIKPKRLMQ